MSEVRIRVQEAASYRLDEIYRYTRERWGESLADRYIIGRRRLTLEGELGALLPPRPAPATQAPAYFAAIFG